jgi:hypothetical protein
MKSILIHFSITLSLFSISQTNTISNNLKRNSLYFEIGGQSIFYSVNYDKLIHVREKIQTSFTVGASIVPKNTFCDFGISTPVSYNLILGKSTHKFVVGIGLTPFYIKRYIVDEISSISSSSFSFRKARQGKKNVRENQVDTYYFDVEKM